MKTLAHAMPAVAAPHTGRHRTLIELIGLWRRRGAERRSLAMMSDRDLRDIGITCLDALREARKPFWRA